MRGIWRDFEVALAGGLGAYAVREGRLAIATRWAQRACSPTGCPLSSAYEGITQETGTRSLLWLSEDSPSEQTGVSSETMARPIALPARKRGRGNPNWGQPPQPLPVLPTEFEMQVQRLGLTKPEYVSSAALKRWCEDNRNRFYVPEWLLAAWRMEVESIFSGVA